MNRGEKKVWMTKKKLKLEQKYGNDFEGVKKKVGSILGKANNKMGEG